ncbi:MAG: caspase family protein [Rhizobiaceae bacterium]|nr:caspase family protein [Rhizobiaceae bacterium]
MARIGNPAWTSARTAFVAALALAVVLVLLAVPVAAQEQKPLRGIALVVGNGEYEHLPPLSNPDRDARAIAELLAGLGFETELSSDRDARRLARDLENFADDAQGADVAVLYYAGHGIEAAGENFLVPVDADVAALDEAGERLVPLSDIVAQLRAAVPITIVMLDACRDNPFPANARLRLTADDRPARVSAGGLTVSASRGASPIAPSGSAQGANDSLGIVLGFAAEPGRTALDGEPGENSPYAAAILRHLGAMAGTDFGTVMRMVAEEVWLKTGGRQRPWVNESLRRLLYFGTAPAAPDGDEAGLLAERRQLLVTISELPEFDRSQVRHIASENGVPMDALFGLLKAMGADVPDDPVRLDEVLRTESARIREVLSDRAALASPDPEVARLSSLADEAEREGLIESAKLLRARAKARDAEFQASVVDAAEEQVKAQRIASAEVFARSAQTYLLAFEPANAAADFGRAFERVERWDPERAWDYRFRQLSALTDQGDLRGDNAAFEAALVVGRDALRIAEQFADLGRWARTQNEISHALRKWGERETGTERLFQALEAIEAAAEHRSRENDPLEWAETQADRARVLARLGQRETGSERLREAVAVYREVLEWYPKDEDPKEWANMQIALGGALGILGGREHDPDSFYEAVDALTAAIGELSPDEDAFLWSNTHDSLATSYAYLADRSGDVAMLERSIEIYNIALESAPRERFPFYRASIKSNLSSALRLMGQRTQNPDYFGEAMIHLQDVLEVWSQEGEPMDWARAQSNLAVSLILLNSWQDGTEGYERAIVALEAALEEWTRDKVPLEWASATNSLGLTYKFLAERRQDISLLYKAAETLESVFEVWTREAVPIDWARTQHNLGESLGRIGEVAGNMAAFRDAAAAFEAALEVRTPELTPLDWGYSMAKLGVTRAHLGYAAGDIEAVEMASALVADAIERAGDKVDGHALGLWKRDLATIDLIVAEMTNEGEPPIRKK